MTKWFTANCPACNKEIGFIAAKRSEFKCDGCETNLVVKGNVLIHVFASVLFVIEAGILFSLPMETWIASIGVCALMALNYYFGFRLFLKVEEQ